MVSKKIQILYVLYRQKTLAGKKFGKFTTKNTFWQNKLANLFNSLKKKHLQICITLLNEARCYSEIFATCCTKKALVYIGSKKPIYSKTLLNIGSS